MSDWKCVKIDTCEEVKVGDMLPGHKGFDLTITLLEDPDQCRPVGRIHLKRSTEYSLAPHVPGFEFIRTHVFCERGGNLGVTLAEWYNMGKHENGPNFLPSNGGCYSCGIDLVNLYNTTGRRSSTGCPQCHYSYCE